MDTNLGRSSDGGGDEEGDDEAAWREWFGGRRDGGTADADAETATTDTEAGTTHPEAGTDAADDGGGSGLFGRFGGRSEGSKGSAADGSTTGGSTTDGSTTGGSTSSAGSTSGSDGDGFAAGLSARVDAVRQRIDPRETAETAARGAVRLVLRIAGAVLVAYGIWVLVAVDGWTRLGAAAVGVGFLPAFAPGLVIGLVGLLWKVFSLA